MYYRFHSKENSLSHSKGPWKVHKYLKKVGNKYYYYVKARSSEEHGVRTYSHIRTEDERSGYNKDDVKEVDYLQEVNADDLFSTWSSRPGAVYNVRNGQVVAEYYSTYRVGKIERYLRNKLPKIKSFLNSVFKVW